MKPRINKDGSPDKRFKDNKKTEESPFLDLFTTVKVNKFSDINELKETPFQEKQYDYEFISYEDLETKVVNMGDYLLMLPQTTERFIKIKVKDV